MVDRDDAAPEAAAEEVTDVTASSDDKVTADIWAAYAEYSKTLRAWLVAYGIGGPVLFVSQDAVWQRLSGTAAMRTIVPLFLIGVGVQVVLAAVNKSTLWAIYYGEIEPAFQESARYRVAHWLARQYWIDWCADVVAIALFGIATFMVFDVLTARG